VIWPEIAAHHEYIVEMLTAGVTQATIHQRLRDEHAWPQAVRRRRNTSQPAPSSSEAMSKPSTSRPPSASTPTAIRACVPVLGIGGRRRLSPDHARDARITANVCAGADRAARKARSLVINRRHRRASNRSAPVAYDADHATNTAAARQRFTRATRRALARRSAWLRRRRTGGEGAL